MIYSVSLHTHSLSLSNTHESPLTFNVSKSKCFSVRQTRVGGRRRRLLHLTSGIERARAYGSACARTHVSSCERGREGERERERERETVTETETETGFATWKGTESVRAGGTGRTNRAAPIDREIAGLAASAATAGTWTGTMIEIGSGTTADQLPTAVAVIVAAGGAAETGAVAGAMRMGAMRIVVVPVPLPIPIQARWGARAMPIGAGFVNTAAMTPTQTLPQTWAAQPRGQQLQKALFRCLATRGGGGRGGGEEYQRW